MARILQLLTLGLQLSYSPRQTIMTRTRKGTALLIVNEENAYLQFLKKNIIGVFPEIRIELANSGEHALQLLTKKEFALIITDSLLQGMGGVNFFLEVKRIKPNAKVILLSNNLDRRSKEALDQKGLFGYLQKPFLMESLSDLIAKTLNESEDIRLNGRKANQGNRN
jgi:two-component system chemotaxis response regulator CheY